eukprot:116821_1
MFSFRLVQLLIFVNIVNKVVSQTFCGDNVGDYCCWNDTDCAGQLITFTGIGHFYAHGYKSAVGVSFTNMAENHGFMCYGAFSCSKLTVRDGGTVNFEGSNAGSNLQLLTWRGSIYCDGTNSMTNTTVTMLGNSISCYGEQSCAYSSILSSRNLYAHAAYAMLGATIVSNVSTTYFALFGYYAGYGAFFICQAGHTCNINCYYNSCYGLTISCIGLCNVNNIADNVTDSPIFDEIPIQIDTNFLLYNSLEITTNNDMLCSTWTQNGFVADNYYKNNPSVYGGLNITSNDIDTPICCRGFKACQYAFSIITNQPVICSGMSSCYRVTNIISTAPVFCEGSNSCAYDSITSKEAIYCMGANSCGLTTISETPLLYCSGWRGCDGSTIFAPNDNFTVYFNGWKAGQKVTIHCNYTESCSIICGAAGSCIQTIVFCGNQCNLQCNSITECPQIITMRPTIDPTVQPTLEPTMTTINPTLEPTTITINPTLAPFGDVKGKIYLITFATNQDLDTDEINSVIKEALIAYCHVAIISTVVDENRNIIVELKVTLCESNKDFIEEQIEKKLEAEYNEPIDVTVQEIDDSSDDKSGDDKPLQEYVIILIIVSIILLSLGIIIGCVIYHKKIKKRKFKQNNGNNNAEQIELNTTVNDITHAKIEKDDIEMNDEYRIETLGETKIGFSENRDDDIVEIVNRTKKGQDKDNEIIKSVNKTYGNQKDDEIVSAINKTKDYEIVNNVNKTYDIDNEEDNEIVSAINETTIGYNSNNTTKDPNITDL